MKKLLALLTLSSIILPQAAIAQRRWVGYEEDICYKEELREVYVPGNRHRRGYVDYERQVVEVPCRNRLNTDNIRPYDPNEPDYRPTGPVDDNSCIEGSIIGGILGGAAVAAGSRGPDQLWAIPLGVVGGTLIGCQVDGG